MLEHYKYMIVGGGLSADSAVRGIRSLDADGSIAMFCEESVPPYDHPPLSKSLWKGNPFEKIWRNSGALGVNVKLNDRVSSIHPGEKTIIDYSGTLYSYEKLLLATGVSPRKLPFGQNLINYYRTIDDYRLLKSQTETKDHFIVIGGGFIGSEIAAALTMNGKQVTIIFPEDGIASKIFTKPISNFINDYYRSKGVNVQNGISIIDVSNDGDQVKVTTQDKTASSKVFEADAVIAGIGTTPNSTLASDAGLTASNGIEVDGYLQTSSADIYSAGDVANYFDPVLNIRRRVEHEDNAIQMGLIAGKNMAGANSKYVYLPYFYSDLFDIGYEAVGELDSRYEIVEDWFDPFKKGILYFLKDSIVRGVLLWNVWGKIDETRALINVQASVTPESLKNKIHE
jgi:NADPH-dependent 2,4-dienoyl-CoA reductase/sulfur reductase-like enzyme